MGIKAYLHPKWWLITIGIVFLLLGTGNYLFAEDASQDAYDDPTDRDVFYEETFGLFSMSLATMALSTGCLLYTSPSPRDATLSRMPSSA